MQTTTTTATTTTDPRFLQSLDETITAVEGQCLLSQGRCVDHLLDLFNLTAEPAVRSALSFALDDIRRITAVRSSDFVDSLRLVAAVAEVEGAFASAEA
jgi:hypothetical protein